MGDKLATRYTGPFVIIEEVGRGVYRLVHGEKIMKQTVNAMNLKLWTDVNSSDKQSTPLPAQQPDKPSTPPPAQQPDKPSMPSPAPQLGKPSTSHGTPSDKTMAWIECYHLTEG